MFVREKQGEDGIMPELIKRINIDDLILLFANNLLMEGKKPDQFSVLNINAIPKSGDLGLTRELQRNLPDITSS